MWIRDTSLNDPVGLKLELSLNICVQRVPYWGVLPGKKSISRVFSPHLWKNPLLVDITNVWWSWSAVPLILNWLVRMCNLAVDNWNSPTRNSLFASYHWISWLLCSLHRCHQHTDGSHYLNYYMTLRRCHSFVVADCIGRSWGTAGASPSKLSCIQIPLAKVGKKTRPHTILSCVHGCDGSLLWSATCWDAMPTDDKRRAV